MQNFLAFTLSSHGRLNTLITDCNISEPVKTHGVLPPNQYKALWDTGATGCVITQKIVTDLGIKPIGKKQVRHAAGISTVDEHMVDIWLPNKIEVKNVQVTVGVLGNDFDILIGMDLITIGDFSITNVGGKTIFSFRCPSIKEIDYVKEYNSSFKNGYPIVGQRQPCPCGSKKRYKNCHGKAS